MDLPGDGNVLCRAYIRGGPIKQKPLRGSRGFKGSEVLLVRSECAYAGFVVKDFLLDLL